MDFRFYTATHSITHLMIRGLHLTSLVVDCIITLVTLNYVAWILGVL